METSTNQDKINLAVLVLAHKNYLQIKELIFSLQNSNIWLFIHLDQKWDISEGEINELRRHYQVTICDNRINASLDEWSLVEATFELIRTAYAYKSNHTLNFSYFVLLSGQDYPIKPINFIISKLALEYPKPFIDCTPYNTKNWIYYKFSRFPLEYQINKWFGKNMKPGIKRKLTKFPFFAFFNIIRLWGNTPYNYFKKRKINIYGGSAWWILPDIAIDEILQKYSKADTSIKKFSKTVTPEETFFQTMTMQTSSAKLVEINDIFERGQNCLTYAHFADIDKPFKGHPYILEIEDFNSLANMKHLFARKFDITYDYTILKRINEEILLL